LDAWFANYHYCKKISTFGFTMPTVNQWIMFLLAYCKIVNALHVLKPWCLAIFKIDFDKVSEGVNESDIDAFNEWLIIKMCAWRMEMSCHNLVLNVYHLWEDDCLNGEVFKPNIHHEINYHKWWTILLMGGKILSASVVRLKNITTRMEIRSIWSLKTICMMIKF
jgi:hypothetical protein